MSLDHVLLGILDEPRSGYDIKQSFDVVFSHFWASKISQIYRHLKDLERRRLLKSWEEPSPKGPPRRLYKRTAAGLKELRNWLREGPLIPDSRLPYVAQTCFLHELEDRGELLQFFARARDAFATRLQMLRGIDDEIRKEQAETFPDGLPMSEICGHLALHHGLFRIQALLDWSNHCLTILNSDDGQIPELPDVHTLRPIDPQLLSGEAS